MMGTTVRTSELMGRNIESTNGDNVVKCRTWWLISTAASALRVLSFGGFANIGDDYYAVPLHVLTLTRTTTPWC